jgi:hypothetical protein
VVVIHQPLDLPGTFGLNYSEIPNRCRSGRPRSGRG